MEGYSTSSTWVTDFMFLSRSGSYSGPIILILSFIIVVTALYRHAYMIAAVFAFLFVSISTLLAASHLISQSGSEGYRVVLTVMRHAGQLLRIFPYALILWMLIKAKRTDANQALHGTADSRADASANGP